MKAAAVFLLCLWSRVAYGQWAFDPNTLPHMPNAPHTCNRWGYCTLVNGANRACSYQGPAPQFLHDGLSQEVKDELLDILENRCPHLLYDEDGNRKPNDEIYTCCAPEQLYDIADSMMLADGVLGRCPTCLRNFLTQICEMNCSPEQSRFTDTRFAEATDGSLYVDEIDYRLHEDYMLGAHASCAGVIIPQTGLPAINMMCGNAPVCDAAAWFGYSGDTDNNPFVDVRTNYYQWPTTEDSMNIRALPCNETFDGDLPCSCVDCLSNCAVGNDPVLPDICTVLSVNCVGFSVGITVFVISVTIFSVLTIFDYRKMRNSSDKPENEKPFEPNKVIKAFRLLFIKVGIFSAGNPMLMILLTSWLIFGMFFGLTNLRITANPTEIWSSPESKSRQDLDYFNSRFGPFYRASQIFLEINLDSFVVNNVTYGPAYRAEAVQELIALENEIKNIGRDNGGVTLEQVCYAPLRQRGGEQLLEQCTHMSISIYLGDDVNNFNNETYLGKVVSCLNNFYGLDCLATWGGGVEPEIAFGGYEGNDVLSATTLVINLPLQNELLEENLVPVLEWEQKFLDLMRDYDENRKSDFVVVSYASERSIEDEIKRVSQAEIVPIAASYVLMFIYVTLALGKVRSYKSFLAGSKVLVAMGSIIIEIVAIFCALGLMGYLGISTTLLAINVIPFFILSIGIDNVFLMVNTLYTVEDNLKQYDDYNDNISFEKKRRFVFGKMMEKVGPSIFVTSVTQVTCFAIGTLAKFPAVITFAIFASFALGFLFIFQMTTVVALLSMDYGRTSKKRLDIFCCIQKKILDDTDPLTSGQPYRSLTESFMVPYSKFITNWRVKIIVAILFMALLSISIIFIPQLEIGLDQEMSLPTDSYVYKYLQSVNNVFKLGVPVYFVLKSGLNFTDPLHQNVICGGQLCNEDSLVTQIFLSSLHSEITYMDRGSNSWIDDFFDWSGLRGSCCKYNVEDDSFCQSTNTSSACQYCTIETDSNGIRPVGEAFEKYLPFFLQDEPNEMCSKGGLASYFTNVNYMLDEQGRATVHDTNFMAYHTALGTSKDYITAVKYGYEISENITTAIKMHTGLDVEVFPYSVFYVYYEQYLTMWKDTFASLGYCMIGAFFINLLASGFNFLTTFSVICTSIMVVVDMMGLMYIWNIPLNAVSCVNLIVSIGIAVEFCSHISYAFATSSLPQRERVGDAIRNVGSTIITGITLTNIPIIVLAFSYTEIIEVFFFRMFFGLVIIGFLHGMVFYPVFLSFLSNLKSK